MQLFCLIDWAGKMPTPQEFQVIKFAFLSPGESESRGI
jgi:hypothetical protein